MKKLIFSTLIVVLISMMVVVPVLAKTTVIKGEVIAINDDGTLTLLTNKGETVTIAVPAGFDMASVTVGASVLVKGSTDKDGKFTAETIQLLGPGQGNSDSSESTESEDASDDTDADEAEGSKDNSAFCSGDKQDKLHPFAEKLAIKYGVTPEWVMGYFCNGYGMGAIMLALKTSQLKGADPATLLAQRAEGKGWGQIWQEMKLIGNEKDVKTPPGWLKRLEHGKPKP